MNGRLLERASVVVCLPLLVSLSAMTATNALAQVNTFAFGNCDIIMTCAVDGDGAGVEIADGEAADTATGSSGQSEDAPGDARFQYAVTFACPGNDPNGPGRHGDMSCNHAVTACSGLNMGPGPMTWIWRRSIPPTGGSPTMYARIARSCATPAAVAAATRPVLTVQAIRQAFRQVDFARPGVHVQPEGNVTLVNLATYFEVQWPAQGFEPREIATVQLLGRSVRIRPLGKSFVYRFGDGERLGPTSDAGGPYPEGRIRHTYTRPAKAAVTVVATYGGEFSVDEGPWQEVGETVTIDGPAQGVQVREAHARLEAG